MTDNVPVPPHLAEIIREQLATGRFQSESDVIGAALRLLDEHSHARQENIAWLKQEIDKGVNSRPSEPATPSFWEQLRARIRSDQAHRE